MGLQSSGSISLSDIAGEFGGSTPHSLSEYYDAASGIPASGQISFSSFYGASAVSHWIATIGGTSIDDAAGIAVDGSGNVYIAGRTHSTGAGSYDALIVKYNADGVIQWQRTLGASGLDVGLGVAVDGSGNVYVHGYFFHAGAGTADFLTVKYNTSGTLQWQRALSSNTGKNEFGYGVGVDGSGNVYVCGQTNARHSSYDMFIAKYYPAGHLVWQRSLGGSSSESAPNITVDNSGNFYVVGSTQSAGVGKSDLYISKFNSAGTMQWQQCLGLSESDYGKGVGVDGSGNVYVSGYTRSTSGVQADALIAKYNASGAIQWQRILQSSSDVPDLSRDIAVDGSGNAYIVGNTRSSISGLTDVLIAKYNTSGTLQWQRTLASSGVTNAIGYGVSVDNSGNIYVGGGSADGKCLIAKLPADGSMTGTYGSFTYAPSSLISSTASMYSRNPGSSVFISAGLLTRSTSSLTSSASNLTSSTTTL